MAIKTDQFKEKLSFNADPKEIQTKLEKLNDYLQKFEEPYAAELVSEVQKKIGKSSVDSNYL